MTAPTRKTEEDFTYRDVMFPEDSAIVRVASGPILGGRTLVAVGIRTDDDDDFDASVALDPGVAIVMALDMISAAAEAMNKDPGPFHRITRADHMAADAAIRTRRDAAQ